MTWKIPAVFAVGLLLGADVPGDRQIMQEVKQALKTLNDAFEKGDAAAIKMLMTADHLAVTSYYGKSLNRHEQLASLPQLKLTEYTVAEMRLSMLGRDAVL